jgi:hypothetical protein
VKSQHHTNELVSIKSVPRCSVIRNAYTVINPLSFINFGCSRIYCTDELDSFLLLLWYGFGLFPPQVWVFSPIGYKGMRHSFGLEP